MRKGLPCSFDTSNKSPSDLKSWLKANLWGFAERTSINWCMSIYQYNLMHWCNLVALVYSNCVAYSFWLLYIIYYVTSFTHCIYGTIHFLLLVPFISMCKLLHMKKDVEGSWLGGIRKQASKRIWGCIDRLRPWCSTNISCHNNLKAITFLLPTFFFYKEPECLCGLPSACTNRRGLGVQGAACPKTLFHFW